MAERNNYPQMTELAESFPSLRGKLGVRPFDANLLYHVIFETGAGTSGNTQAAAFVLTVFNSSDWHAKASFNVARAVNVWDREHLAAFQAWVAKPWTA